ncbi:MAG: hypothetical protein HZB79_04405 [Deltaproteobacteria bacterium]|nr:hypothetical protein [Deltaproteobacteria bacterium]
MKRYILALAAIIIASIVFISISNGKNKAVKEGGILSVNDIQADPYAYKGTVTITGVVAGNSEFKPPKGVFLMVETSEAKICKQTGCAKFYLPVKYEGEHPKEWDEVNVTGSFSEDRKLIFKATKVDVLRHLTF